MKQTLNESYVGRTLEDVSAELKSAGYKIVVIPEGIPAPLTENFDGGRATLYTAAGKIVSIVVG